MTTVKNLQFWLISFFLKEIGIILRQWITQRISHQFLITVIYIMIYENGNVIHDFSKLSLTHFSLTKNNLLAGVSKGKCYPNSVIFFLQHRQNCQFGSKYHYYVCVSICVWFTSESQLAVHTQNQLVWCLSVWLSASPSHDKKITLFIGQCVCPQSPQAVTFGI